MNTLKIVYFGLSRLQLQTLMCHFPIRTEFVKIDESCFESEEEMKKLVSTEGCVFLNPQKLSTIYLGKILDMHESAKCNTHATLLLFSNRFTKQQIQAFDTKRLHIANLTRGRDRELLRAVKHIKSALTPCSNDFDSMRYNMFGDGWYLVDFETSGIDPLSDEIISFTISYMSDYHLESTNTYYIKQKNSISKDIEALTGITNEMLENGIEKGEIVRILKNLPSPSPIILYSESYYVYFLKALFMSLGEHFDMSYITLEELSSYVFGYMNYKSLYDILPEISKEAFRGCERLDKYVEMLYNVTVMTFESLRKRYRIESMGELEKLY